MNNNQQGFTYVAPPVPPRNDKLSHLGAIDYSRHPAYAALSAAADAGTRIKAVAQFAKVFAGLLVKRIVRYEMIPYHLRQSKGPAFAKQALLNAFRIQPRSNIPARPSPLLDSILDCGIGVVEIGEVDLDNLRQRSQSQFDRLADRRNARGNAKREFEESRSNASRDDEPQLYLLIESLLRKAGVMDAASAYFGREVKLVDANPQINDRSDSFWRDIFPDMPNAPLSSAAYFHRDASGGDLKAIIYLSDVDFNNGPFSYVLRSNQCPIGRLDDLICEANDHALSATTPEARRLFAALPRWLQLKGAFGNDLPSDSDAARFIKNNSWVVTGKAGSIILFDTKGVHRGGMVESGERRAITCVLG